MEQEVWDSRRPSAICCSSCGVYQETRKTEKLRERDVERKGVGGGGGGEGKGEIGE